mmetsp:Transcript_2360/g.5288  ORF Transcript_2360/g.5288 Transcript_2360/m.5288 type:complete len:360 (-) Transcript_2360:313-1392(-)|eukprot:CAMPEP_0185855000 /NCGR_PEP_ID=MMETSP1354-20130828/24294_1 /TAXON_ID=708628 /ORGANISM="Erythrolobus madagascarensis, Strain CCMP3276" /LENGTH=359 /DNA_ID=CAMNT_0028556913 /DNA_START=1031 /DNA_END=2110 /DNA_ORIENTATION=+
MTTCADCNADFGIWRRLMQWVGGSSGYTCGVCSKSDLCALCAGYAAPVDGNVAKGFHKVCRACLSTLSSLNFDCTADVLTPANGGDGITTVVLVHGGGGCRAMYRPLARHLSQHGFRCVLLDLPGHGARVHESLTIESAIAAIVNDTREHTPAAHLKSGSGRRPIYLGGSLGGYIGAHVLGERRDLFEAGILVASTQGVGVRAGWKAWSALNVFAMLQTVLSPFTLSSQMLSVAANHPHLARELIEESCVKPGSYFHSGPEQVAVLQQEDSVGEVAKFPGPILFIQGDEDHHDQDLHLLNASKLALDPSKNFAVGRGVSSQLLTIHRADHFFSHDSRHLEQFHRAVLNFCCEVANVPKP